jgi:hypothetical protein
MHRMCRRGLARRADAGADYGEQAFATQVAAVMHVEGADMMRQADEIGARSLIGAGVGDVEDGFVR